MDRDTLRVGYYKNSYPCLDDTLSYLKCEDTLINSSVYWLQMFAKNKIQLFIYPNLPLTDDDVNDSLVEDLKLGYIDVSPDWKIEPEGFQHFFIIPNLRIYSYYLYTIKPAFKENGSLFLFHPFSLDKWLLVLFGYFLLQSSIFTLSRLEYVTITPHHEFILNRLGQLKSIFVVFVLLLYSSNLKALISIPNTDESFTDMKDLAEKLENGERYLFLESNLSSRFDQLTNFDNETSKEFFLLGSALKKNPNSLIFIENVTDLCRNLSKNKNAVYLSYDLLVELKCPDHCLSDHPVGKSFFHGNVLSRKFPWKEEARLYQHAVENYRMNLLRMKKFAVRNCDVVKKIEKSNYNKIGFESFIVVFKAYLVGAGISMLILVIEKVVIYFCYTYLYFC